jgi:hypothetical protein
LLVSEGRGKGGRALHCTLSIHCLGLQGLLVRLRLCLLLCLRLCLCLRLRLLQLGNRALGL